MIEAQRSLKGEVKGGDGEPLVGVNVYVKDNPTIGTVTDFDGSYQIEVPSSARFLIFSYTGYNEETIEIGAENIINATLKAGITLEAAIVTALGIPKQEKSIGYGVTTVKGEEITRTRNNSAIDALSGKVAGLTVASNPQPGGGTSVIVRGFGSVTGKNQALWVVDGVPMNNASNVSANTVINSLDDFNRSQDFGNQSNDINPDDIESLTILKGAAATALYGSRAANGAVIVTTKSGKNNQGLQVDITSSFTQSEVNRLPRLQSTYGQGWNGLYATEENGSWGPRADGKLRLWGNTVENSRQLKPFIILDENLRDFYGYGRAYSNSISITGGNDAANFRLSYGNTFDDGVVPTDADSYKRHTLGFKGEVSNKRITVGASLNVLLKTQKALATGQGDDAGAGKVLFQELIQLPRDISIIDLKDYKSQFNNLDNYFTPYAQNPYFILGEQGNKYLENRFYGNAFIKYNLFDDLDLTWKLGGDISNSDLADWGNVAHITPGSPNSTANDVVGRVSETSINLQQLNSDLLISYKKELTNKLDFSLTLGHNVNTNYSKSVVSLITNLTIPGFYNLSNSTTSPISQSNLVQKRLIGVFGILDVNYNNWLYATFQARNDWSSTLPAENNSFFYPAVTLSGIISDALRINGPTLSFLKVRASLAQVGNDAPAYSIVPIYTAAIARAGLFGTVNFPISGVNAFEVGDIRGNNQLKPEITSELEFGLDARFFKNRVGLDVALYNRTTTNQIINVEKDPSSGYLNQVSNIGEINNRGVELVVSLTPVKNKNFQWDLNYNFTKNRNEVVSLGAGNTSLVLNTAYDAELRAEEGKPVGAIYIPTVLTNEEGAPVVNAANGLPLAASEKKYMGSANPDYVMGIANTLSYQNWKLSFNLDYRQGGVFWSYTAQLNYFVGHAWKSQYNDRQPFIIPGSVNQLASGEFVENTTPVSRADIFTYWGSTTATTENEILDKTFVKLRNLSLSYELPQEWVKRLKIKRAGVTVYGRNLALWTPSSNHFVDPEGSTFGLDLSSQIGEFATSPSTASYGITFNLSF